MVVVVVVVAMAPMPIRVLVTMVMMVGIAIAVVQLRELEGLACAARLLILGAKHIDRVRDGIEQLREGLRGFQAGRFARGGSDRGARAADESERRSAAKQSND